MDLAEQRKREYFGKRFVEFLTQWMKEQHKTQKDFCAEAGVSKNIVTDWKKGKRFPQDAQLMKICEVFDVDPRAFNPFFPIDKQYVENTITVEESKRIQKYADEKGLKDDWYQYIISKPYFLERFPFAGHSINEWIGMENFDLVKYEFADNKGHRIMLTEKDIDFLIDLQEYTDTQIDYLMYKRKQKIDRERVERLVDQYLKNIDIDRAEVLKRLYLVDLSKENRFIDDKTIWTTIDEIAKEKNITYRYTKKDIAEIWTGHYEEAIKGWREWGKMYKREEEAEKNIRELREMEQKVYEEAIERYRKDGTLIEDEEV